MSPDSATARARRIGQGYVAAAATGRRTTRASVTNSATRVRLRANRTQTAGPTALMLSQCENSMRVNTRHATKSAVARAPMRPRTSGTNGSNQTKYWGESTFPKATYATRAAAKAATNLLRAGGPLANQTATA